MKVPVLHLSSPAWLWESDTHSVRIRHKATGRERTFEGPNDVLHWMDFYMAMERIKMQSEMLQAEGRRVSTSLFDAVCGLALGDAPYNAQA